MKSQSRNLNIDIIRCTAVFLVISVHFFLNNGFYDQSVLGKRMYVMILMRTCFMVCVPLFITLSGYLMCYKILNGNYYKGIIKTYCIYVLASIASIFFKVTYLKKKISFFQGILGILDFTADNYSWYIEMYLGLFLLIPFLNMIWSGLESKKKKQWWILTLIICTTLPSLMNIWNFSSLNFWIKPSSYSSYYALVPDWWTRFYPLTYYFIGAYLREYEIKIPVLKNLLYLIVTVIIFGSFNYYRNYSIVFQKNSFVDWGSFENLIDTVLLFVLLLNIKTEKVKSVYKRIFSIGANLALGTYLCSYIFDSIFYKMLIQKVEVMTLRLEYYILIVPAVFLCSMLLSFVIHFIYECLYNVGVCLYRSIRTKL